MPLKFTPERLSRHFLICGWKCNLFPCSVNVFNTRRTSWLSKIWANFRKVYCCHHVLAKYYEIARRWHCLHFCRIWVAYMYSWILVVNVVQLHIFMFLVICCDVRCDVHCDVRCDVLCDVRCDFRCDVLCDVRSS